MGEARTIADVDSAASALQQEYRNRGFATVFVSIPEQDVVGGVVRLQVTESKIRRVKITGSRYFTLSGIRKKIPSLVEGEVLHVPTLQTDLQVANQASSDLKLVPVIERGPTEDSIDVELNVDDVAPIHGGISVSDYHTEGTTPTRLSAEISYKNLWQKQHQLSLQSQVSPENTDEVQVVAASYMLPKGDAGEKYAIYSVFSDSELATVGDSNVIGDGTIIGFRYVNPFKQSPHAVHSVSLGFDYKDFKEDIISLDDEVQKSPIEYVSWTALYNGFNQSGAITDEMSAAISFGIRNLVNNDEEFDDKRSVALPNFSLVNMDWTRSYRFAGDWQFSHRLRGQFSGSPLVSNEQLSAGGVSSVRGYYEAQIQGDLGVIANLKLETPDLNTQWSAVNDLHLFWFFDAAHLQLEDALPGQEDEFGIQSTGFGLRGKLMKSVGLDIDSGYTLRDESTVRKNTVRTRARLSVEF
jgi:hemolysin activation/secretion protein